MLEPIEVFDLNDGESIIDCAMAMQTRTEPAMQVDGVNGIVDFLTLERLLRIGSPVLMGGAVFNVFIDDELDTPTPPSTRAIVPHQDTGSIADGFFIHRELGEACPVTVGFSEDPNFSRNSGNNFVFPACTNHVRKGATDHGRLTVMIANQIDRCGATVHFFDRLEQSSSTHSQHFSRSPGRGYRAEFLAEIARSL